MENNVFFKIVCIDDNNVFEYRINEDTNRKTLDEIHEFVKQNINKYPKQELVQVLPLKTWVNII